MNKKTSKLIAILLMLVFACSMLLVGCGKKGEAAPEPAPEKTLESLAKDDPSIQQSIDQAFANSSLDGSVAIEGNTIKMVIAIDSQLGDITLDDNSRDLLYKSFDDAFSNTEEDLKVNLAEIESSYEISGVALDIVVTYKDEAVYSKTITS